MNHVSFARKTIGFIVALVWIVVTAGLNLAVAHFRDAADGRAWDAAAEFAMRNLIEQPLRLESIESWLLAVIGAFFALIALVKSYRADDPYPGYGLVARRWAEARDEYAERVEEAVNEIAEHRDEAKANLEDASAAARHDIQEAVDIFSARTGLMSRRDEFLTRCNDAANQLLSVYREANRTHREAPAPAHFAERFVFEPYEDRLGVSDARVAEASREAEEIRASVDRAVKAIYDECARAIESYKSMEELEDPADALPWRSRTGSAPDKSSTGDDRGPAPEGPGRPSVRIVDGGRG
jgi:vacuolar-type H+-ATPase subunit H